MPKLSEQQIQRALEVSKDFWGESTDYLRLIAPLVQFPWEPLTQEEFMLVMNTGSWRAALDKVFANRNAALLPPPVDTRREKILTALKLNLYASTVEETADAILKFLDNTQSR